MPVSKEKLTKHERYRLRDLMCHHISDLCYPVAVRPGGFWDRITTGSTVTDDRFRAPYPGKQREEWHDSNFVLEKNNTRSEYLFHWTRGVYGPWRGQITADFFEDLTNAKKGNPHNGLRTMLHIVQSGVLRGEGRMIKTGEPVISLTALSPYASLKQIKYRPALGRWNFEPYGIAIKRTTLVALGAKPVIYGSREEYSELSESDKPYFQFEGSRKSADKSANWRAENEWRLVGDLDLDSITGELLLITFSKKEAEYIKKRQKHPVVSFEDGLS